MDQEGGAAARFAVERNRPAGLLHDRVDGGESKAGTGAFALSGEEGIEYVLPGFGCNADSGIGNREQYVVSGCGAGVPGSVAFLHVSIGRCDGEPPAARHGVCLLYTSPSPRDGLLSRMPSSA